MTLRLVLADDGETIGLEDGARLDAEAGVIIDDEDGIHGPIVAQRTAPTYRVSPHSAVIAPGSPPAWPSP